MECRCNPLKPKSGLNGPPSMLFHISDQNRSGFETYLLINPNGYRTQRKPMLEAELSGVFAVRAATR
jgi:hypothetical protein